MQHNMIHYRRLVASLMACGAVIGSAAAPAVADRTSYPDISAYASVGGLQKFRLVDTDGVWFTTPVGLKCAIGDDGSYGCSGVLPGTPNGDNEIGWFPGDSLPRLYHTDTPKFALVSRQSIVNPLSVLAYHGSRCAVDEEGSVYCINGDNADSQIMVTARMTYRGSQALPSS